VRVLDDHSKIESNERLFFLSWRDLTLRKKQICQCLFLSVWSFLFVLPLLLKGGPNIVTLTFQEGADRFFQGQNPYALPGQDTDVFHYPPFFAVLWGVFDILGISTKVLFWVFLNCLIFWLGISKWWLFERKQTPWAWFFLICTAVELDISVRYQQSNALVTGLILLALAAIRDRQMGRAGIYFAVATHIKVFPVFLALIVAFSFPVNWSFLGSFLGALLICFSVPSFLVGPQQTLWLHWAQFQAITQDFSRREMLDIAPCMARLGFSLLGKILQKGILFISAVVMVIYRLRNANDKFRWQYWYSIFVTTLLLVTPRAESPTFVWAAPAYLLFSQTNSRRVLWGLAFIGFFLSLIYSSAFAVQPFEWFRQNWTSKTLATLGLWLLSVNLLFGDQPNQKHEITNI